LLYRRPLQVTDSQAGSVGVFAAAQHTHTWNPFPTAGYLRYNCSNTDKNFVPIGTALEKLAQNGRGVKRATQRAGEFLCCMAARIRALCALGKQKVLATGGGFDKQTKYRHYLERPCGRRILSPRGLGMSYPCRYRCSTSRFLGIESSQATLFVIEPSGYR
jgi:hypothetical protein